MKKTDEYIKLYEAEISTVLQDFFELLQKYSNLPKRDINFKISNEKQKERFIYWFIDKIYNDWVKEWKIARYLQIK